EEFQSVGDLEGDAVLAELLPLFSPGIVDWAFGVVGGGLGAGKFDDVDAAPIANLGAFGFQPDIFDAGNFGGHVLDAGDSLILFVLGSSVAEFVGDDVNHGFGLAKFV